MDGFTPTVGSGTNAAAIPSASGTVLRPVIFVVDATNPAGGGHHHHPDDDVADEPFDVRRTSLADFADGSAAASGERENLYDTFLAALQGKPPGDNNNDVIDDEISMAASYASSTPAFSPGSGLAGDDSISDIRSSPTHASSSRRFMSPFSRLRVGRWKASSPVGTLDDDHAATTSATGSTAHHDALARDMEDDPDDTHDGSSSSHSDNVSSALNSYSKDNPPVHFMSKRARIVSVSRRHAFPPSKLPKGKMDPMAASSTGGTNSGIGTNNMLGEHGGHGNPWMSSYEIQNEGILPSGWLEKHARALPSALVVVTDLQISNDDQRRLGIKNATRAVEDLRMTLAEKRSVPIHLVCLLNEDDVGKSDTRLRNNLNAIKEKICQDCYLPQSQVFLVKTPCDLEPDDFESGILRSPYVVNTSSNNVAPATPGAVSSSNDTMVMMNPLLRQLDRSLRDTSALYYSRLAESQEQKLMLWRNRYHNTNVSFEVNTLMAAMRCARYAMKVGTLREFQMRTGGNLAAVAGGGSNGRWTDKNSSAMRHYDEAYRWVVELHRRAISWRATALSSSSSGSAGGYATFPSPVPITPGRQQQQLYSMDGITSPKLTESPGGGIGVELSLPGVANVNVAPPAPSLSGGATPPPPLMRRNSPALTSKKGYNTTENISFFASLWEQCRAVASIINTKLLRSTNTSSSANSSLGTQAEEQWSRHCIIFLANPQGISNFSPSQNDDFFGPAWHRFLYVTEELLTFACIAEGRWRRAITHAAKNRGTPLSTTTALSSTYHQPGAPWKAHGELCEALLGLRMVVKKQSEDGYSNEWLTLSSAFLSGRRKFVGSIVSGDSGLGTMPWRFENESKRDHRAMALDYVLHALDLLDENLSLCSGGSTESETPIQPNSSTRLHYLAARLLMTLDNPMGALVHLKIASAQTKSWPSLHLSIQRALFACEERCATDRSALSTSNSILPSTESKDSCIELLLRSEICKLLSPKEMTDAQTKAWKDDPAVVDTNATSTREVVWTHDEDTCRSKPPFEFAVSFLKSTHATSSDTVTACVSIKSRLDFQVCIESMQLLTTSGTAYDVSNLEKCAVDTSLLQTLLQKECVRETSFATKYVPNRGVQFNSNDLAFFLTELTLPSNVSDIALGGASADTSKFIPKNGRLCNTGFTHAAGNICESRFESQKISINGKPIPISSISEASSLFLGGIPLLCHGVCLILKQPGSSDSSLKLQIERPRLISPLLRSGTQQLLMEESLYTAHSWSRPAHHPWCLGPRVLRVLGPRPQMHVTNLTESQTDCKAVEGTVNRIVLRLEAGSDEDCWDVRVRLKCKSSKKPLSSESANDGMLEGGLIDVEPYRMPTFVHKSADPTIQIVTEIGVALPVGWEPRKDVGADESHDVTTPLSLHLRAGKSLLFPLDVFCPLDQSFTSSENDASTCSTSYEAIIMYRQVRAGKGTNQSEEPGDQVLVMQSGSIEWISPFTAEFSQTNGSKNPFPCGIQHPSNTTSQSSIEPPSVGGTELVAAYGEHVQMRCSLEAKGIGSNIAASILRVTNEVRLPRWSFNFSSKI